MPLTGYPGGAASFGVPAIPGNTYDVFSGPVYFVCNRTGAPAGDGTAANKPMASLADALARLTGDITGGARIYVLEGHAENVTASNTFSGTATGGPNTGAQVIPAGCRIIGCGVGRGVPNLTFTAAGSTLTMAAANASIENINLLCAQTGTTTNAALVTVTASGCRVIGGVQQLSASATALATTGISLAVGANEFYAANIFAFGVTGTPTSWLSTTGTVGPSRVSVRFCIARLPLSATTGGLIDCSANSGTAGTDWDIRECDFANNTALSTVALKFVAGMTGQVALCGLGIKNATGAGTSINSVGNMELIQTFCTVPAKAGLIVGTVSG